MASTASVDAAERIARAVRATFDSLPTKSKPLAGRDGTRQWVPCSAVVASFADRPDQFECLSLATGAKCLPATRVPAAAGHVLHDSHAEILALRLFNYTLACDCLALAREPAATSRLVRRRSVLELTPESRQPFGMRDGIRLFLYCSEAPCGDASMELCMNAQANAAAWPVDEAVEGALLGRGYFSELGVVRRKPARADSPITLSKSCSDKIALRQYTSLLSSVTSLLISPENVYLYGLVVPKSQYLEQSFRRCFSERGRLAPTVGMGWPGGYGFMPFLVLCTQHEFEHSRRLAGPGISNVCAAWSPYASETIINGILQGRKDTAPGRASVASRIRSWQAVKEALRLAGAADHTGMEAVKTYGELKRLNVLEARRSVKRDVKAKALCGWVANEKDDFPL